MSQNIVQRIEIPSRTDSLIMIEALIDELCSTHGIKEDCYGNMLIAITEAVNNAITHGNKLDVSKNVNLEYESSDNEVLFTIRDQGSGFDYNHVPDPTQPENITKLNGRGVFLMKNLADEVLFEENGSKVLLRFSISAN
jgi:anti-sigma regulatory factor (Ser/Thr protein kinase)